MKRKTSFFSIFLIVILSLSTIALSAYLVYDKFLSSKSLTQQDNGQELKLEDLDVIFELLNNTDLGTKKITDFNELPNQLKLSIAYSMCANNEESDALIKSEELQSVLETVFGQGINFEKEDIQCQVAMDDDHAALVIYDSISDSFIYNENHKGHGAEGTATVYYNKLVAVSVQDNQYSLSFHKLIGYFDYEMVENVYADFACSILLFEPEEVTEYSFSHDESSDYMKEDDEDPTPNVDEYNGIPVIYVLSHYLNNYDEFKTKSPIFRYTFQKIDNIYILKAYDYLP